MYRKYLEAAGEGDFYKRPLSGSDGNEIRYGKQPLGVNKLGNLVKIMAKNAGLKARFTNFLARKLFPLPCFKKV